MDKKENIFQEFIPQLKNFVQSEMVFGKPYEMDGVTIIPVNSVKVGFAFGEGSGKNVPEKNSASGAGGGGVMVNPIAFIIVKDGEVSLHNITNGSIENIMDKIPDFLEKLLNLTKKIKKEPAKE